MLRVAILALLLTVPVSAAETAAADEPKVDPAAASEAKARPEEERRVLEEFDATGKLPIARTMKEKRVCQLCPRKGLSLTFALPLWAPWTSLNSTSDGVEEGEERPQLIQLQSELRYAFVGELSLRVGQVDFRAMALGAALGTYPVLALEDQTSELGEVQLGASMVRGDMRWRLRPLRLAKGPRATLLALWPHFGARYYRLSGNIYDNAGTLLVDPRVDWVDPLMGWSAIADFHNGLTLSMVGDVGGFTVGSDVAVFAQAKAEYHFFGWLGLHAGWMLMYSATKPNGRVARLLVDRLEIFSHGPSLGLSISPF